MGEIDNGTNNRAEFPKYCRRATASFQRSSSTYLLFASDIRSRQFCDDRSKPTVLVDDGDRKETGC